MRNEMMPQTIPKVSRNSMELLHTIKVGFFWLLIWAMRLRYAIVLAASPALLGVAAWRYPNMLLGLLLVRSNLACWDLWVITWMSLFTTGLGIGVARLVSLNGADRFPSAGWLLGTDDSPVLAQKEKRKMELDWPRWLIMLWWVTGLILPGLCMAASHLDGSKALVYMGLGIGLGWLFANFVALLVAGLQQWTLGGLDGQADAGILPFESLVRSRVQPWTLFGSKVWGESVALWLFGTKKRGFSRLLSGPGFCDTATGVLLPGHAQLVIVAIVSTIVYFLRYSFDLNNVAWDTLGWPTVFFGLVSVFIVGWFICGMAFWLDRYNVPPILVAIGYVALMYSVTETDHQFELNPRDMVHHPAYGIPSVKLAPPDAHDSERNLYLAAINEHLKNPDRAIPEQVDWYQAMQQWNFPDGGEHPDSTKKTDRNQGGNRTLVVVTASGGGIQAAAWTAKVLTELDHEFPGLSQSIGLISGVSGGSVGVMYYLGLRGIRNNEVNGFAPMLDDTQRERIVAAAESSSLEAVGWGLAFPDLLRSLAPFAAPKFADRGWALESVWWNRMTDNIELSPSVRVQNRLAMSSVSVRDLAPFVADGRAPAVVFNSTCVETGQRVLITPIRANFDRFQPADHDDSESVESAQAETNGSEQLDKFVLTPIDFLHFYDQAIHNTSQRADPRISTAVRLSASFEYVAPVTRPARENDSDADAFNLHFCDGGYADNPGLVTAVRFIEELIESCQRDATAPQGEKPLENRRKFDRILLIRIEPFPITVANKAKENHGFESIVMGPSTAMASTRVSTQAERAELEVQLLQEAHRPSPPLSNSLSEVRKLTAKLLRDNRRAHPEEVQQILAVVKELPRSLTDLTVSDFKPDVQSNVVPMREKLVAAHIQIQAFKLPASMDDLRNKIVLELKAAEAAAKQVATAKPGDLPIPVFSVTFRFGEFVDEHLKSLNHDDLSDAEIKAIRKEPPLSWTLSEAQKRVIDLAWEHRRAPEHWDQQANSSADKLTPSGLSKFFPKPKKVK
jgi:hypothetical protein